jgi:hypothetical protein
MPSTLELVIMDAATNWGGQIISRQTAQYLFPSCVVRLVIRNTTNNSSEAIYFEITKVKDGTFWGVAKGTYRQDDLVGIKDGEQMTFRREHINEIPMQWQPKRFLKAVRHLDGRTKNFGYSMTGLRGI